jgi:hypothetical protein
MPDPDDRKPEGAPFAYSAQDAAEFMQRLWNPMGIAMPGFGAAPGVSGGAGAMPFPNPAAMFATIDPAEVERKIAELKVVENWLTMSLAMMQMSIKTLELQKAALEALQPPSQESTSRPSKK